MTPYKEMATLLESKLSKEDFLRLQELMDGDEHDHLWEAITDRAIVLAPELFVDPEGTDKPVSVPK